MNLEDAMKSALRITMKEKSRFRMDCIAFIPREGKVVVGATDAKRLYISSPVDLDVKTQKLVRWNDASGLADPMAASGESGEFPDLFKYIPTPTMTAWIPAKELTGLRSALKRMGIEIRKRNRALRKQREELQARIDAYKGPFADKKKLWEQESALKDLGSAVVLDASAGKMSIYPSYDGESHSIPFDGVMRIAVNPDYLLDALIGIKEPVSVGFTSKDDGLIVALSIGRHVIMPCGMEK